MNRKQLAVIIMVTVLVSIIATTVAFTFLQFPAKNGVITSIPSPSLPLSSSLSQSLTPDEIATLKADSLELEIKDMFSSSNIGSFYRIDSNMWNASSIAQETAQFANYASVSETEFLKDIVTCINNYGTNGLGYNSNFSIFRVDNTFYLTISSGAYPQADTSVYCTP